MDRRALVVVLLLTVSFIVGAAVMFVRRGTLWRAAAASPIVIENAAPDSLAGPVVVNLNTCRQYELEALPGIGPSIAGQILSFRERHGGFRSVDQLRQVPGIGTKRLSAIREYITVEPVGSGPSVDSDSLPGSH